MPNPISSTLLKIIYRKTQKGHPIQATAHTFSSLVNRNYDLLL